MRELTVNEQEAVNGGWGYVQWWELGGGLDATGDLASSASAFCGPAGPFVAGVGQGLDALGDICWIAGAISKWC